MCTKYAEFFNWVAISVLMKFICFKILFFFNSKDLVDGFLQNHGIYFKSIINFKWQTRMNKTAKWGVVKL